jgi:pimeloyl-ACP methyl ester carboxylesterase
LPVTSHHEESGPYWEVHHGKGPYLLMVHGFLSSRAQWLPNIEALSKICRPVVVELYGHGRSPSPESPDAYHPDGYVRAFENIRRNLGASRWFICGQSLGASLTLRYALKHPEAVTAQVFTNTVAGLAKKEALTNRYKEFAARLRGKRDSKFLETLPMHPVHARFLGKDVKAALLKDSAAADLDGISRSIEFTMPEVSVRDVIHLNQVPSLLVCGKREKRFQTFREFAQNHMPMLKIVDLEAGHAVNIAAAEGFNRAVFDFIAAHAL